MVVQNCIHHTTLQKCTCFAAIRVASKNDDLDFQEHGRTCAARSFSHQSLSHFFNGLLADLSRPRSAHGSWHRYRHHFCYLSEKAISIGQWSSHPDEWCVKPLSGHCTVSIGTRYTYLSLSHLCLTCVYDRDFVGAHGDRISKLHCRGASLAGSQLKQYGNMWDYHVHNCNSIAIVLIVLQ